MNPALQFDADSHTYRVGGEVVPGVTSVIERCCQAFAGVPGRHLIPAQERGTVVHRATELFDLESLDMDSLDEDLHGYLRAWEKFRTETRFEPDRLEYQVFSPKYFFAGTLDRTGTITWAKARRKVLADIKTGTPAAGTALQTAAYQRALKEQTGDEIKLRMGVHLQSDGEFKVRVYDAATDLGDFLAMLRAYRWMERN